ncbi:hypothetical protein FYJ38_09415 [Clostridium sp. WB02_MRS01]|uniref:hypothetical protein n=1 Tax=Clostridium sp. WB02_MRS01 TaxID=2605777 RepID=UPI0012B1A35B|nr:hypothetical protein [Clostridium sp. WB02_MRS01]MSS08864.1 hypothetical protein [Clostridium sp. WB02_MRS01]
MGKQVRKVLILTGFLSLSLFGGVVTSYAAGPGETKTSQAIQPVTYNQQSVRALGNWEQQSNGTWVFRQLTGDVLTNSWIESLTEQRAYYYVGADGVMLISSKTPDGSWVDGNGVWRSIGCTAPSVSESSTSASNKSTASNDNEISQDAIDKIKHMAENYSSSNLH